MVVNTHNAESCAFRGKDEERALLDPFGRLEAEAGAHDVKVVGSWVNRASHEIFLLVDAPNAHVIEDLLLESGLVGRTHSRVLPVVATDEAGPERS